MMHKPRVVFFGNERLATGVATSAPTLLALVKAGYEVVAVVSNYEVGTSRNARSLEIADVAKAHHIPVLLPARPSDIMEQLASYSGEVAVLVAYGKIVPQEVIDIFPRGILNIHPSLLPLHRGPTPIESVLLNGEKRTGVSLMQLSKQMDAGPVFAHSEVVLTGAESKQVLADTLLEIGSSMVIELLPGILDGSIVAKPQDDTEATYDTLITKSSGLLDFTKSADVIEREIRAYLEWPKSFCTLNDNNVIIKNAKVVEQNGNPGDFEVTKNSLIIFCGQNSLEVITIQPAGKKEMPIRAFLAGNSLV